MQYLQSKSSRGQSKNQTEIDAELLTSNRQSMISSFKIKIKPKVLKIISDKSQSRKQRSIFRTLLSYYSTFPILNPTHPLIITWNALVLIAIIFYLFEIGFLLGFGQIYWLDEINYFYSVNIIFIVIFIIDTLGSPVKSYYENGILIENRVVLLKRYIRFELWLNIIAIISIIVPISHQNVNTNWIKVLFLLKLHQGFAIDRSFLLQVRNKYDKNHVYAISRIIFYTILWSHYLAVGFFAIDYAIYVNNYYGPNTPNFCWIYNSPLTFRIHHEAWWIQYLYSIYFSIGNITTIAYGDIIPINPLETLFTIFSMILTILLFTYFFKEILEIIFFSQADNFQNANRLFTMNSFIRKHRISPQLTYKIQSFFQISWRQKQFRNREDELEMLGLLPKTIKEQLNLCLFGDLLKELALISEDNNIFYYENKSHFIFYLLQSIQFEIMSGGDIIYQQFQEFSVNPFLYFCDKRVKQAITIGIGKMPSINVKIDLFEQINDQRLSKIYDDKLVVAHTNGLFGDYEFFTNNRRLNWVVCNKNIELLKLEKKKFEQIVAEHAKYSERQKIFLIKQNIYNRYCHLCKSKGHHFQNCHFIRYMSDRQRILKRMKEVNERMKDKKIVKIRQLQQQRQSKNHIWKIQQKNRQESLNQKQKLKIIDSQDSSVQEDENQGINLEQIIKDLFTYTKKGLKVDNKNVEPQIENQFEFQQLDIPCQFQIYKPQCNIEKVLAHYQKLSKNKGQKIQTKPQLMILQNFF